MYGIYNKKKLNKKFNRDRFLIGWRQIYFQQPIRAHQKDLFNMVYTVLSFY
jgi:hypothetical protein